MASIHLPTLPPVPGSDADMRPIQAKSRFWLFACVVSGIVFLGAPFVGLLYTVMGMKGAFVPSGGEGPGSGVGDLGNYVGEVLVSLVTGLFFTGLALPILILSIVKIVKLRSARRLLEQHRLATSAHPGN